MWPETNDAPTGNLFTGGSAVNMQRALIARHGSRAPGAAPQSALITAPFPGRINVGFVDGHVELSTLDNLSCLQMEFVL